MKAICNSLILVILIPFFISCEKKDSDSSSYSYFNEPDFVKQGLIGYYPFNGDVKDYSGFANHAAGSNPTFTPDRFNYSSGAIHFNGVNDFLRIPKSGNSFVNNEGTIILWCKIDTSNVTNDQTKCVVLSIVDSLNTSFLLSSRMGALEYSFGNYPTLGGAGVISGIHMEGFKFFVLTFTDNSVTIYDYIDGSYHTETRSNPVYSFGFNGDRKEQDIYLGKSMIEAFDSETFDNYFTWFKGDIDDLLIYNRILTDDEIMYFFNLRKLPG
jgi:hypothetical protein